MISPDVAWPPPPPPAPGCLAPEHAEAPVPEPLVDEVAPEPIDSASEASQPKIARAESVSALLTVAETPKLSELPPDPAPSPRAIGRRASKRHSVAPSSPRRSVQIDPAPPDKPPQSARPRHTAPAQRQELKPSVCAVFAHRGQPGSSTGTDLASEDDEAPPVPCPPQYARRVHRTQCQDPDEAAFTRGRMLLLSSALGKLPRSEWETAVRTHASGYERWPPTRPSTARPRTAGFPERRRCQSARARRPQAGDHHSRHYAGMPQVTGLPSSALYRPTLLRALRPDFSNTLCAAMQRLSVWTKPASSAAAAYLGPAPPGRPLPGKPRVRA